MASAVMSLLGQWFKAMGRQHVLSSFLLSPNGPGMAPSLCPALMSHKYGECLGTVSLKWLMSSGDTSHFSVSLGQGISL